MSMVRKQVYITERQEAKLKRVARKLGATEAEMVRRAIDGLDEKVPRADIEVALELIEQLSLRRAEANDHLPWSRADIYTDEPRPLDPQAWLDELAFIKERARLLPDGGSTFKWKREDSYEEAIRPSPLLG
jgi:hypothetical protein